MPFVKHYARDWGKLYPRSHPHNFDPLRIALVILHADPARGGAERYTVDLAAALRRRGHEVRIISSSFAPGPLPQGAVHLSVARATRLGRYMQFLDRVDA